MVLWPHQYKDNLLSKPFNISWGICQGSVLSPTIFNLVMSPLLSTLRQRNHVNGLFLWAFAHADNIQTSAANIEDATEQVLTVDSFTFASDQKSVLYSHQVRNKSLHPVLQLVRPASQSYNKWNVLVSGGILLPLAKSGSIKHMLLSSPQSTGCLPWFTESSFISQYSGMLCSLSSHVQLRIMGAKCCTSGDPRVLPSRTWETRFKTAKICIE